MTTNNQITLATAEKMTTLYRENINTILASGYQQKNILARSETFSREGFEMLLSQPGCVAVRIYYGMDAGLKVHAIAVGVNQQNEDILPPAGSPRIRGDGEGVILEEATRCPDDCPPKSPLNP